MTALALVVRTVIGVVIFARMYAAFWFLLATFAAVAGLGRLLTLAFDLPAGMAFLLPISVILLAFVHAVPPEPRTESWPTILFHTAPAGAVDRLLRWARGYLIVTCSLAALLVPLTMFIVILWVGFGIRWGW